MQILQSEKPNKSGFVHGVGWRKLPSLLFERETPKNSPLFFLIYLKSKSYETITKIPIRGYGSIF